MPQTIPFICRWSDSGVGAAWMHVAGELDLATVPQFEAALHAAQINAWTVVVDLRALTFIDCLGAHAIADAAARARQEGRRLMVVRGGRQVNKVLTLTGAAAGLEIFDLEPPAGGLERAQETVWAVA